VPLAAEFAARQAAASEVPARMYSRMGLNEALAYRVRFSLPQLLREEDRNSMAFSIESRLPFLDYRLVEFAFALPDTVKLEGATTKAIARRALADRVPASVLARRDKMGFETPADLWIRRRWTDEVRRRLTRPGPFQDWVDGAVLRAELEASLSGRRAIGLQVWRWLSLEAWSQRGVARDPRVGGQLPGLAREGAGRHLSRVDAEASASASLTDPR
jgi:asparagine synthase (glutamine-hydrolysing)